MMSSEVSQQLKKIGSDWMKWLASFHKHKGSISILMILQSTKYGMILTVIISRKSAFSISYVYFSNMYQAYNITRTSLKGSRRSAKKHMADPHVSCIIPLETSGYDEATTLGNQETVHNIIERQLGIPPDAVEGCLIPTSGDCATIACL